MAGQKEIKVTTAVDRLSIADQILRPIPPTLGLIAWAHWYAIPRLIPHDGSPAPYMEFIPAYLLLLFGAIYGVMVALVVYPTWKGKLIGGALPASFVLYTLAHFIR